MLKNVIKKTLPTSAIPILRAAWNCFDLLRIRKNRSYLHGLLFDLRGTEYKTEGMSFRIAPEQFPRSYRSRLYFDVYEAPERILVRKWVTPGARILELGGCVGVLSCVINSMLDDPTAHVVVEANPTLIEILSHNRDANSCAFRIENSIVSPDPEAEFFISSIMTANRKDSKAGRRLTVPTITYAELERRYNIRFDTLILDIEGGEYDFFNDNADRLGGVDLIILELHRHILTPDQLAACTTVLESAGLRQVDSLDETEVWKRIA